MTFSRLKQLQDGTWVAVVSNISFGMNELVFDEKSLHTRIANLSRCYPGIPLEMERRALIELQRRNMGRHTIKIENWTLVVTLNPYAAPETRVPSLTGEVCGHPKFPDGKIVQTSSIVGKNQNDEVQMASGNTYRLGQVNPDYEKRFPGAKERLLNSLPIKEPGV